MNTLYLQPKRYFLLIALASLFAFNGFAQKDSIYVYKDGSVLFRDAVNKFDSITFTESSSKKALNIHFQNTVVFNKNVSEIDSVNFSSNVKMLPLVTTGNVSEVGINQVTGNGSVLNDGGSILTARGLCWSTESDPSIDDNNIPNEENTIGAFTNAISGLTPGATYYIRAYATNEIGTAYGETVTFTTKDGIATLTTTAATNILVFSATSGGSITNDGGASITERGICWGTNSEPTIEDDSVADDSGAESFTCNITDLSPNTTYYVRAYVTNEIGTFYGDEISFTTQSGVPSTLTTSVVKDILETSATGGGTAQQSSSSGLTITECGICWSTEPDPTIEDSKASGAPNARGVYTCAITELSASTTYYVRSYAINAVGTFYGPQVSFTTEAPLSGKNWMSRIPNDTYLRNITIPGTHDSGTSTASGLTASFDKCQDWDIATQLNNGIRLLDMRFKVSGERLRVYHGTSAMDLYYEDVFNTIRQFLTDNPTETVIVSIRNENDGANDAEKAKFKEILNAEMSANSSKWFTETSFPKLSEARGKMVLFRRYDDNKGVNMCDGWGDDMTFNINGGRVQDVYNITTTGFLSPNYNAKWDHISSLLTEAHNDSGSKFFVNFCSGVNIIAAATPKATSNNINPRLQTFMDTASKGKWGWILMDFPTVKLVEDIYMKNIQ